MARKVAVLFYNAVRHGMEYVDPGASSYETRYRTRWGEWRTRVRGGRCVFLRGNACAIHTEPFYPAVCRGFPWIDAETGGPYEYDRTICPEFLHRPELNRDQA